MTRKPDDDFPSLGWEAVVIGWAIGVLLWSVYHWRDIWVPFVDSLAP